MKNKWLWESNIPLVKKIKYEISIRKAKRKQQIRNDRIFKWFFIRSAVIDFYTDSQDLDVTPSVKAKQEMESKIKTVEQLEYWYKKAYAWRKKQWKLS